MKFKFDCWNNQLWKVEEDYSYEVPEEQKFTARYGDTGFVLDSNQPNHWISFTLYGNKIRAFYKQVKKDKSIVYYQKDIQREKTPAEIVEFEMTENDMVAKRDDGKWAKV